ncbi:periaxin isoform X11 [Scophthalmus maximus]|uniref:periaxin isoform X11 n=1 Tax=Scophthalmus maximus TaxID=52904 RepID=UPI001FA86BC4|nr:periaxin isoform X11 [Scophthalmus maximus]
MQRLREPRLREPRLREPELREPELREPELREPELREPRLREPRLREPELREPRLREPRLREPRLREPRLREPRLREPRLREPRLREPELREPRLREPELREPIRTQTNEDTSPTDLDVVMQHPETQNSPRFHDVLMLCCDLCPNVEIKNTLKCAAKGGSAVGTMATVGGLLLGPPGLLVGGVVGSFAAYWWTKGDFKPVHQIIMELSPSERQQLYDDVIGALENLEWEDCDQLYALVRSNPVLMKAVQVAISGISQLR